MLRYLTFVSLVSVSEFKIDQEYLTSSISSNIVLALLPAAQVYKLKFVCLLLPNEPWEAMFGEKERGFI